MIYQTNENNKNSFLQVLGNGNQCKPYSHSSEILDSIIFVLNKKHSKFINYYNLGTSGQGVKVKIVNLLKKNFFIKKIVYEKSSAGWKGDVTKYKYSNKKITKLGYGFSLSSLDAVKKAIFDLDN